MKMIILLLDISGAFIHLSPQLSGVQIDNFLFEAFAFSFAISPTAALICAGRFSKVCWH